MLGQEQGSTAFQAGHFDAIAGEYEDSIASHVMYHLDGRRLELIQALSPSGRVLDVGCGTGKLLARLPDEYEKVGVDVSESMTAIAAQRGLEVRVGPAEALPFEDASFDLVMSHAVLHHLVERSKVRQSLREICRVVRPGGVVLVWDHNPLNPYWPILMRRLPQDSGEEQLVPARIITDELGNAGMDDVVLRRWTFVPDFTPRRVLKRAAQLERILERTPGVRNLAAHNVVTARKPPA